MSFNRLSRILSQRKNLSVSYSLVLRRRESTLTPEANSTSEKPETENLGGFAKAFIKQSHINDPPIQEDVPFETLLRKSKFIDLGDPEGRIVTGTIFHVVDDDLYIDFGWKFHCVCPRPSKNGSEYVRGAKVRLRVKELELSTKFLGSERDLTLLEADAQVLGLLHSPIKRT